MDPATVLTTFGKVALDLAKEIRSLLADRGQAKESLVSRGGLLKVYGSLVVLEGYAAEIRRVAERQPPNLSNAEKHLMPAFLKEIHVLADALKNLNLSVLDIYYPGLGEELRLVIDRDIAFGDVRIQAIRADGQSGAREDPQGSEADR